MLHSAPYHTSPALCSPPNDTTHTPALAGAREQAAHQGARDRGAAAGSGAHRPRWQLVQQQTKTKTSTRLDPYRVSSGECNSSLMMAAWNTKVVRKRPAPCLSAGCCTLVLCGAGRQHGVQPVCTRGAVGRRSTQQELPSRRCSHVCAPAGMSAVSIILPRLAPAAGSRD